MALDATARSSSAEAAVTASFFLIYFLLARTKSDSTIQLHLLLSNPPRRTEARQLLQPCTQVLRPDTCGDVRNVLVRAGPSHPSIYRPRLSPVWATPEETVTVDAQSASRQSIYMAKAQ